MADSFDKTLTIFLGRGLLSQGIRQTIEDFTATGLIRNLVWVDADAFETSASLVTELRVDDAGQPHIARRPFNELVSRSGAQKMNLGVINVVDSPAGTLGYAELSPLMRTIDSVCANFEIHRTNLMITSVNAPLEGQLPVLSGYLNLMLAPEDSPGPDASTVAYHHGDLDHSFVLHCSAGIASLFGLWEGSTSAPVADLEPAKGSSFRLVRAFYRHIDGQAVQARLKDLILATEENPLPKLKEQPGTDYTAQYTENPEDFSHKAAAELFGEFDKTLVNPQRDVLVKKTQVMSSGQATKEFLGAWWKNLIRTPRRAWDDLRSETLSLTDDALQAGIYGTTSTAAHVGQAGVAAHYGQQRSSQASQVDQELNAAAELVSVWTAYANTSMSLLDAEPRFIGPGKDGIRRPAAVKSNASERVIVARKAADVIPGPKENYGASLPVEIKVRVEGGEVAPYDVIGQEKFEEKLARHSDSGQRGIGAAIGEFKQWKEENSNSYAYFVAQGLRDRTRHQMMEKRRLESTIADLEKKSVEGPKVGKMASIFRWLGYVIFWSAIFFAGVWWYKNVNQEPGTALDTWVLHLNSVSTAKKWTFFSTWFALWLLCVILQNVGLAKDKLRIQAFRDTTSQELRTARENLEIIKNNLVRLEVGYQQFLSTSKIIGTLLEKPFGRISKESESPLILENTVPDSVVFAEATPDSLAVDQLARRFRREVFEQGWLGEHVLEGINRAAQILAERTNSPVNTKNLFATTGNNTFGDLGRLAASFEDEKFLNEDRSVSTWSEITRELINDPHNYRAGVLDSLTIYRAGHKISAPSYSSLEKHTTTGSFNGEIATEIGRVHDILELDPNLCKYETHINAFDYIGLSEVLLQVSGPVNEQDIAFKIPEQKQISAELIAGMPVDEDFPTTGVNPNRFNQGGVNGGFSARNNKNTQLPGMGEY
ncbi:hypothetical protein SFC07_09470 [Corynebacterium callunae]|uniref:hypothetical protein n=1 Tax=Corynebacterium callunae TaxID=1721 RepID=UPI003981EB73